MTQSTSATPSGGTARGGRSSDRRSNPNYAARRMLVTTVAITAVVGAGVLAWSLTRDEPDDVAAAEGDWNQVALVDRATGAVTLVDAEGAVGTTLPGDGRPTAVYASGDRLAIVGTTQIVLTGLDDDTPITIPVEPGASVTRLAVADSMWLAVGKASGGNVVLVDGRTGTTIDIGELAGIPSPRFYVETIRHDPEGSTFAIADATNFQTVVVRPGAVAPVFLADQPVAVGNGFVVTSQVVGQQADVTVFDDEQKAVATVKTALPAGGVLDGDEAVIVSVDGDVYRIGDGDEQADQIGTVAVPADDRISSVRPTANGTRLVVSGQVFEAVIDLSGKTVFTTTFATDVAAAPVEPDWSCLPVGGGESYHSVVALDSGEQLADLTGLAVTGTSASGCVVIGTRNQATEVVGEGGSVKLGPLRAASLAPDGGAVVRQTEAGLIELVAIDDDWALVDPVDVTAGSPANPFVAFLRS